MIARAAFAALILVFPIRQFILRVYLAKDEQVGAISAEKTGDPQIVHFVTIVNDPQKTELQPSIANLMDLIRSKGSVPFNVDIGLLPYLNENWRMWTWYGYERGIARSYYLADKKVCSNRCDFGRTISDICHFDYCSSTLPSFQWNQSYSSQPYARPMCHYEFLTRKLGVVTHLFESSSHKIGLSVESDISKHSDAEQRGGEINQQHVWGEKERERATSLVLGLYTGYLVWWWVNRKNNKGGGK